MDPVTALCEERISTGYNTVNRTKDTSVINIKTYFDSFALLSVTLTDYIILLSMVLVRLGAGGEERKKEGVCQWEERQVRETPIG